MEIIYDNFVARNFSELEHTQIKVETRLQMPDGVKKMLGTSSAVFANPISVTDNDIVVSGRVVTRIVYINDLDKYDSIEQTEPFEIKIFVKNIENYTGLQATATIADTKTSGDNITNIVDVDIYGGTDKNIKFVSNISGDAEVRYEKTQIGTFDNIVSERFGVADSIELDKNCEGVLGIDANAAIRDISCSAGKINIKGIISVNTLGVKTTDGGTVPYNAFNDIDFAKSITAPNATADDLATGMVYVTNSSIKIENGGKAPVLNIDIELAFNGASYINKELNYVEDAISFNKELSFDFATAEQTKLLPPINSYADIENNINLPEGTPYAAKVLSVDGVRISALNVMPLDNKVSVEGVLTATIIWETEEHEIHNYGMELPAAFNIRADGVDTNCKITASVVPISLNVKARRGVELLIDARLGVGISATDTAETRFTDDVTVGADKAADDSAISVHIIGDNETLWDVIKHTNVAGAELIRQNPNLENGCVPGDRVIVYRHNAVNF
jgi:hypothetical protein